MIDAVEWNPKHHGHKPHYWKPDMAASLDNKNFINQEPGQDWAWIAGSTYYVPYEAVHGVRREVVEGDAEPVDELINTDADLIDGTLKEIKSRVLMMRNEAAANSSPEFMGREGKAYQRAILDIYDMLDAFEKERSND
jgi:hypothetical protein